MLSALENLLGLYDIDGYITPMADNHLDEFINNADNKVKYLTGFTGTAGTALTMKDYKGLYTDGRYYEQASRQLEDYELIRANETTLEDFIISRKASRIGIDPHFISHQGYERMRDRLAESGIELVDTDDLVRKSQKKVQRRKFRGVADLEKVYYRLSDGKLVIENGLIDKSTRNSGKKSGDVGSSKKADSKAHGPDRSGPVENTKSASHPESSGNNMLDDDELFDRLANKNITGSFRLGKIRWVRTLIGESDGILITELDTIAWLFNLRGIDIKNNMVFYSYAYISADEAILFTNSGAKLEKEIDVRPYEEFEAFLKTLKNKKIKVSGGCNRYISSRLSEPEFIRDIKLMQSLKNEAELYGMARANMYDAVALVRLFEWIEETENITEKHVASRLINIKKENREFVRTSFDTIAGSGTNGAELHHANTDRAVNRNGMLEMLLIDSGSQYLYGTTDITRTICKKPTKDQREKYTLVLKGVLASKMRSGDSATGGEIDRLARKFLKEKGYDYNSATGHGVGAGLFVHENPPRIVEKAGLVHHGQAFSIEPGYYEKNAYGIRIEDVGFINKSGEFVNLTYVPLHLKLINAKMLTDAERDYINAYSAETRRLLEPHLEDGRGLRYLIENTKVI